MAAPVKATCPIIDNIIRDIRNALNEAIGIDKNFENSSFNEIKQSIENIISHLNGVESNIEDIRDANSMLRDWGHQNEELIEKLNYNIAELEDIVERIKDKENDVD